MISLLLFPVVAKVPAGEALQRTSYPQSSRYRYRENDIYTHFLCPDYPAKLWISQPPWRTRQIEHLMISIPLSSRDSGVCRARQITVRHHSTPSDHGEKSFIAVIANPII